MLTAVIIIELTRVGAIVFTFGADETRVASPQASLTQCFVLWFFKTMEVMEEGGELIYLFQLIDGSTGASCALNTAALVGIPDQILRRAAEVIVSSNVEWTSSRSKAPHKRCLFSIPPPSKDCPFPLGLGRKRLWVGALEGALHKFWLIDWVIDWLIGFILVMMVYTGSQHNSTKTSILLQHSWRFVKRLIRHIPKLFWGALNVAAQWKKILQTAGRLGKDSNRNLGA